MPVDHRPALRKLSRALLGGTAHDDLVPIEVFGVDLDAELVTSVEL